MKNILLPSAIALSLAMAFPVQTANAAATTNKTSAAKALNAKVEEAPLRAHLALLSSDSFEGRGTGQRGGDLVRARQLLTKHHPSGQHQRQRQQKVAQRHR